MKHKIIEYLHNVFIKIDNVNDFAGKTPYLIVGEDAFYVEATTFFVIKMNISVVHAHVANKELVIDIDQSFRLSNLLAFFNATDIVITSKEDEEGNLLVRIKISIK